MKYQPGLPEQNNNVSTEHPLKEFFLLAAGAAAILLVLLAALGLLVDAAVGLIDPATEAALFRENDDEVLVQNAREQELQALLDELGQCVEIGYPAVVRIEESEQVNALARPGGQIVVYSALLDALDTENGLAFVLAHELGHYVNRDHLRGMGRAIVLLAASVLLTGANSDISALLTPVYGAELAQYSQSRESAADAVALHALNCRYGHVAGAIEFFEQLAVQREESDWSLVHYFSSHPQIRERIRQLTELAGASGYALDAP